MDWYVSVWKKYAVFSGRARRSEYWYFNLINAILSIILAIFDYVMGGSKNGGSIGLLGAIYSLAVFLPSFAVLVRRLHDTGRGIVWLLIGLVPLVGVIVLFIFTIQDSEPGDNRFGPNPKLFGA